MPAGGDGGDAHLPLSALLAQVLLAFTLDFERESDLSLAISANVVRLIGDNGARVRVMPRLAGVSKQAISMTVGFLEKRGYAVREAHPNDSRARLLRLTAKGGEAHDAYRRLLVDIGTRWRVRFGEDKIRNLRTSLDPLAGASGERTSLLCLGLEPHAGGWRASVRKPDGLPHHPVVLHRGGFPDGG